MKKSKFLSTFCLCLMILSSLFVANLSPFVKAEAADTIGVYKFSGNVYKDTDGNKYYKQMVGINEKFIEHWTAVYSNLPLYQQLSGLGFEYLTSNVSGERFNLGEYVFFKYEPITWLVLDYDESTNQVYVASARLLANMAVQPTINMSADSYPCTTANGGDGTTTLAVHYLYSNVRYWLNGYTQTGQTQDNSAYASSTEFNFSAEVDSTLGYPSLLTTAFTSDELSKISETEYGKINLVANCRVQSGEITLMSEKAQYFTSGAWYDYIKLEKCSDFAVAHMALGHSYGSPFAYLGEFTGINSNDHQMVVHNIMTSGDGVASGIIVDHDGSIFDISMNICPAMWIDATDLTFYKDWDYSENDRVYGEISISDVQNLLDPNNGDFKYSFAYIQFGSYPQSAVRNAVETVDIPATGVSINTMGIILSSTILIGLFAWMGTIGIRSLSKKRKH